MAALRTDNSVANRSAEGRDFCLDVVGSAFWPNLSCVHIRYGLPRDPLSLFLVDRVEGFGRDLLLQGSVISFVQFSSVEVILDVAKGQESNVPSMLGFGKLFFVPVHGRLTAPDDGIQYEEDRRKGEENTRDESAHPIVAGALDES